MDWVPNTNDLKALVDILGQSTSASRDIIERVRIELENFNKIPEYNNYLSFIFSYQDLPANIRNVAGILLKTNVKSYYTNMPRNVQAYIKSKVLPVLSDNEVQLRHTVGNIVVNLINKSSYGEWKELLPGLMQALENSNDNLVEGSLYTVSLLCEDTRDKLEQEEYALNLLVPKLLQFLKSPNPFYKRKAIISLSYFIHNLPGALLLNMESYLKSIFALSSDPNSEVRVHVCKTIVSMVYTRLEFLMPYIGDIVKYMLHASRDTSEEVALEACEFWPAIADARECRDILAPHLPVLIPILLNGMIYSEDEIEGLDQGEDSMKPDRPQDIRPVFANTSVKQGQQSQQQGGGQDIYNSQKPQEDEDDDDDDDDDDFDSYMNDYEDIWTIRKSCALAIDKFSDIFPTQEYLTIMLPEIENRTKPDKDWPIRESAILALGAIADGKTKKDLAQFLPHVVPFLINTLNDPKPLVRSITCWTLSRYSNWISQEGNVNLQNLVINLLNRILDNNKKVQEAACSAFATLEEEAEYELIPYLPNILQTFASAFEKYQAKNLLILYDAITTLARSIGPELNKPEYIGLLLPPLITKYNNLDDNNKNILPLFGCLHQICSAVGHGLGNYIIIFYNRARNIIQDYLEQYQRHSNNPKQYSKPDSDFAVSALDIIQGLAEGIQVSIESLISQSNLPQLLLDCMKVGGFDILQSAFALLGDLSKYCIVHLKPLINEYLTILSSYLNSETPTVCNNAIWAISEITLRDGAQESVKAFLPAMVEQLIQIINNNGIGRGLFENTAVLLGRLGALNPLYLSQQLERFCKKWCLAMRRKYDDFEKDSAFRGLWLIINANPNAALKHLMFICDAVASWERMDPQLLQFYRSLLLMYKNAMGDAWTPFYGQFPVELRKILDANYFNPDLPQIK